MTGTTPEGTGTFRPSIQDTTPSINWTIERIASFEELKKGFPTLPFSLAKVPSISKLAADKAISWQSQQP